MLTKQMEESDEQKQKTNDNVSDTGHALVISAIKGIIDAPKWAQNALKAVAEQILLPYADIPKAWAEGTSSQIRARNKARTQITEATTNFLLSDVNDNTIAARAMAREARKIFREQVSLEDIVAIAAERIEKEASDSEPEQSVSEDWLNSFEQEASSKSSEEMKEVFGRILAGEVLKPGTFSIRAVRLVGSLSTAEAKTLRILFGMASYFKDGMLLLNLEKRPGSGGLSDYGLDYTKLAEMQSIGILGGDFSTGITYGKLSPSQPLIIFGKLANSPIKIEEQLKPGQTSKDVRIDGLLFTSLAYDLAQIVEPIRTASYEKELEKTLSNKSLKITFKDPIQ